jgi:hypothetical protein
MVTSMGHWWAPIDSGVDMTQGSFLCPLESITVRWLTTSTVQAVSVSISLCLGCNLNSMHWMPSCINGRSLNACKAEVLAPVLTFALICEIPNAGNPNHSRHPKVKNLFFIVSTVFVIYLCDWWGRRIFEHIRGSCRCYTSVFEDKRGQSKYAVLYINSDPFFIGDVCIFRLVERE